MRRRSPLAMLLLLSVCASAGGPAQVPPNANSQVAASRERLAIFPAVAHHQHLLSPMSLAALQSGDEPLQAVTLPPELDRLLQERGAISGSSAPNDLFTEDAQLLRILQGNWIRGRPAVQDYLGFVARGLRYRANAYELSGSNGYIAGTVELGEPGNDVLNFLMAVRKGADGRWRIAAESATVKPPPQYSEPIAADELIAQMDDAGIERAVVLSTAYFWGSPSRRPALPDEYDRVRADNDWTVEQVRRFPERLVAFCGVNPLRDYALRELDRCAAIPGVRGMKLHFANSGIDVRNPEHLEQLRRFFRAANARRLAIVAHILVPGGEYGAEHARIFLNEILPQAPDVTVQIAHLAGSGPPFGPDEALAVFAEAFEAGSPLVRNLYLDPAGISLNDQNSPLVARRLRQIGLSRILWGSDAQPNPPPAAAWSMFRRELPLTDDELRVVAGNVAPYMR